MVIPLQKPGYSWWFNSHNSPRQSPWLLSSLAELDEKTKAMLKLIEQDADSFAQRAEMYYKKRPELVNMVEDFYRTHRSLVEQLNQLKLESRSRQTTPMCSPVSSKRKTTFDSDESEIDDPEEEEYAEVDNNIAENTRNDKIKQANEEMMKLKEENDALKKDLLQKDEDKREVIRQLCLSMDMLKEENKDLKQCLKESKKKYVFDFKKLGKDMFCGKIFGGNQKSHLTVVPL